MPAIDRDWFKDELKHQGRTSNELSKFLKIDPSAVTRIFAGDRKMTSKEAILIAEFLNHPLDVILDKAGLPVGEITPARYTKTIGLVDKTGIIKQHKRKRDAATVPLPPAMPAVTQALLYDTTGTHMEYMDRWALFYVPEDDFRPEALNRLCVVKTKNNLHKVAIIKKGDGRGQYRLFNPLGKEDKEQKQIITASPVLWIRT